MRTKKVKPPIKKFDYLMYVSREYDDIIKKEFISFGIQTTKEFLTFKYQLKIDTELRDNKLTFHIIGFKAPRGELSNPGYAEFEYRLYDFNYEQYNVQIERKDAGKVKFNLKLRKSKTKPIELSSIPRESFIAINQ